MLQVGCYAESGRYINQGKNKHGNGSTSQLERYILDLNFFFFFFFFFVSFSFFENRCFFHFFPKIGWGPMYLAKSAQVR